MNRKAWMIVLAAVAATAISAGVTAWWAVRPGEVEVDVGRRLPTPESLAAHCRDQVGEGRVEEVAEGVFVAIGYDLANTVLVKTADGNVVVDVSMSPARAREVKAALMVRAPGPTRAIVLTHSHIDHVGGASVWMEEGTKVWATDAFTDHFFKQYGVFREAESRRGRRQFGQDVGEDALPCSALGRRPSIDDALEVGVRMPTDTFSGQARFEVGGVTFELFEAHGETHDQLFVWLADRKVLMCGDNYYAAFPNLYTIRGTSPRPVKAWIASLDQMRALEPEMLVPSHTTPVRGAALIQTQLTDYRDAIQWIRAEVIRGANAGVSVDELAATVGLPAHLRAQPAVEELYGQVDWSVRAIYDGELGWFDGRAETLYPLAPADEASRTVALMGGPEAVRKAVAEAQASGEHRWALHLVALLRRSGDQGADLDGLEVASLRALGGSVVNTNGRGYLLQRAMELSGQAHPTGKPTLDDAMVDAIPLDLIFEVMSSRLIPARSLEAHETVMFELGEDEPVVLTVRHGVAEVRRGAALPRTPEALAVVKTDGRTWRRIALGVESPAEAVARGALVVEGDRAGFLRFVQRFERGI